MRRQPCSGAGLSRRRRRRSDGQRKTQRKSAVRPAAPIARRPNAARNLQAGPPAEAKGDGPPARDATLLGRASADAAPAARKTRWLTDAGEPAADPAPSKVLHHRRRLGRLAPLPVCTARLLQADEDVGPGKYGAIPEELLQNGAHHCKINPQIKRAQRVEVHAPNVEVGEVQEGRLAAACGRSRCRQNSSVWRLAGRGQASRQPYVGRL